MSEFYDTFDIVQVDEETRQIVSSYISLCQHQLLANNSLLRIIPDLVTHLCISYYFRTHCYHEWKVTDAQQLQNIRNAVPGQSFNHHFKLHKLDWFLKFYPNGTKQSKQGNVFLLLYLRSTPEISRMSATCKVWLRELDKGREHYKDFNDKNKYTGWRSGLVRTSEISDLDELTFQVTISIFEIYDKDGDVVTDKYIGLGIDSKQTITYLRKELRNEKAKVQRLTIEVDELSNRLLHGDEDEDEDDVDDEDDDDVHDEAVAAISMSAAVAAAAAAADTNGDEGMRHHINDDEHDQKTTDTLYDAYSPKALRMAPRGGVGGDKTDICQQSFEHWLAATVKLAQYNAVFSGMQCNDIRMIEFFDDECLRSDVGITCAVHRRLILKKADEFRDAQQIFFETALKGNVELKEVFEEKGILRMKELRACVHTKQDIERVFGFDDAHVLGQRIWQIINE